MQLDDGNPTLPCQDQTFRRNTILDVYNATGGCQGAYFYGVLNGTVEENTQDHCGWYEAPTSSPTAAETALAAVAIRTIRNQGFYTLNNTNFTIRGNLTTSPQQFRDHHVRRPPTPTRRGCARLPTAVISAANGMTFGAATLITAA